ncbi:hypothetical protein Tco_1454357, partial [Tanacetum coccineum]
MGILYKSMEVQNKLGSNNLALVLKQESMEYIMKNVFGLRWNCRELKGIVKLGFSGQEGAKGNDADRYRENSNEATFAVAIVEIYAHESLTFNDTVACEVISKWKAGLKEDMYVQLDVYVLSNGCRKSNDDSHDYYWSMHQ